MNNKFDYRDVNLIPKKCVVKSRSECDTSLTFGGHKFKLPVVPANMSAIITPELAENLASNGFFYIMHRFMSDDQIIDFIQQMEDKKLITSISVGVQQKDKQFINKLYDLYILNIIDYPDFITIDIAHGHADSMKEMISHIKTLLPKTFIIAGNVCTREAVLDLKEWGADCAKVGIAPGKACTTAFMTSFGSRDCQASTVKECSQVLGISIIADGGIQHPGDIAVAIVMGADMIMAGSLLGGCKDSPGNLVIKNEEYFKEYWGSASIHESGKANRIEGTMKLIPYKQITLLQQMIFIEECLQSAISYAGGKDLIALKNTKWK